MRQRVQFGRAKPRKKAVPSQPITVDIENLSHEGRGVARHEGKTLFVRDALPGETVEAKLDKQHRKFDEGHMTQLLKVSEERTDPFCDHYSVCGGCQLQHLAHDQQIHYKQQWVLDQLARVSQLVPEHIEAPLLSDTQHYRRAARIGINQRNDNSAVVGFRRQASNRIETIDSCPILDIRAQSLFNQLTNALNAHSDQAKLITHAELTFGDDNGVLCFRVKKQPSGGLTDALLQIADAVNCGLYFDLGEKTLCHDTQHAASFSLPAFELELNFEPGDFIQVNSALNRKMISRAVQWLNLSKDDYVLDLFCGLGNFSLPLATQAGQVIGVEGSETMVARAKNNAERNELANCKFYVADLSQAINTSGWYKEPFNKILVDPPRTGAFELVQQLANSNAKDVLYVSCNPSSLARDGGELQKAGFKLSKFCVMDMFPHTTHVESLALFTRD